LLRLLNKNQQQKHMTRPDVLFYLLKKYKASIRRKKTILNVYYSYSSKVLIG